MKVVKDNKKEKAEVKELDVDETDARETDVKAMTEKSGMRDAGAGSVLEPKWKRIDLSAPSSGYLIARDEGTREAQKELLYRVLGPVFFGKRAAGNLAELAELFREKYGIDVLEDFCEGDEHYEEYREAQQAISEGLSIYDGKIPFRECGVAELADQVWGSMEEDGKEKFRRINTMLEE